MGLRNTFIAMTIYVILFLGVTSTAIWLSTAHALQPAPEPDHTVVFREANGYDWAVYQMGDSIHMIRRDTITALIWTKEGRRNDVYYTGGRLSNNLSPQELRMAVALDDKYKESHDGHSPPISNEDFIYFSSLPSPSKWEPIMSCSNERANFEAADVKLTESLGVRDTADQEVIDTQAALSSAQNSYDVAIAEQTDADQAVATNATQSDDAYSAYIACINGPEPDPIGTNKR